MAEFVELICPFCCEKDFDAYGLKIHLLWGWCDAFNTVSEEFPNLPPVKPEPDEGDEEKEIA